MAGTKSSSCTKSPPGSADRSYGIHVARLAGLPEAVIARAEQVLEILEKGDQAGSVARLADDLPLFSVALRRKEPEAVAAPAGPSAVEQALAALNPDDLTPKAALEELYRLRGCCREKCGRAIQCRPNSCVTLVGRAQPQLPSV